MATQKIRKFIEDITRARQICTYVLVYPLDENNPRGDKHCVYAKSYNPQTKQIHCINSDAHNPEPKISVDRLYNKFYQVSCVAELETQPLKQTYPKSIANIPNSNPDARTRKATNERKFMFENKKNLAKSLICYCYRNEPKQLTLFFVKAHHQENFV